MRPSAIALPTINIKSQSEKTSLTSAGKLVIDLPDSCEGVGSTLELEQLVGRANLWIAKQGLCHFMIDLFDGGMPISHAETLHHLEAVIMECHIWQRLELGLVPVTEPRDEGANRMAFSIQHPDLSSALTPPGAASVAVFRSLLCSVDLHTSPRRQTRDSEGVERYKGKKTRLGRGATSTPDAYANDENEEYDNLASDDRDAVDEFVEKLSANFEAHASAEARRKRQRRDEATDAVSSHQVAALLSTWLETVLLGGSRSCKTVVLTQNVPAAPLSRLAPGVFDVPYLKNVSAKREFMSTISASLARMGNAESPSLRKKVERLGRIVQDGGASGSIRGRNEICTGIELRIWSILAAEPSGPRQRRRTGSRLPTTG